MIDDGKGTLIEVVREALLIVKWGGELTETGRSQAEQFGHEFRGQIYPGTNEKKGFLVE